MMLPDFERADAIASHQAKGDWTGVVTADTAITAISALDSPRDEQRWIGLALSVALLAACEGGGGPAESPGSPPGGPAEAHDPTPTQTPVELGIFAEARCVRADLLARRNADRVHRRGPRAVGGERGRHRRAQDPGGRGTQLLRFHLPAVVASGRPPRDRTGRSQRKRRPCDLHLRPRRLRLHSGDHRWNPPRTGPPTDPTSRTRSCAAHTTMRRAHKDRSSAPSTTPSRGCSAGDQSAWRSLMPTTPTSGSSVSRPPAPGIRAIEDQRSNPVGAGDLPVAPALEHDRVHHVPSQIHRRPPSSVSTMLRHRCSLSGELAQGNRVVATPLTRTVLAFSRRDTDAAIALRGRVSKDANA